MTELSETDLVWSDDGQLFSSAQQLSLAIFGAVVAFGSLVGSSLIIRNILSNRKILSTSLYERLMLGLSVLDALGGLGSTIFGPWSVPKGVPYVYGARGTWSTCEASGFFLHMTLGAVWYSGFLSLYYVMLVRFEMKERLIAKRYEPIFHTIAILFPLITAPIALANNYFNPLPTVPGTCWLDDYPPTCTRSEGIDCVRGIGYKPLALITGAGSIGTCLLITSVSMCLITAKVHQTELRMRQYAGAAGGRNDLELTRTTGKQAMLYISTFILTYTPLVALQLVNKPETRENRWLYFVLGLFAKLFVPTQGVFNCLIYFYRRNAPQSSAGTKKCRCSRFWRRQAEQEECSTVEVTQGVYTESQAACSESPECVSTVVECSNTRVRDVEAYA